MTSTNDDLVRGATAMALGLLPDVASDLVQLKRVGAHPASLVVKLHKTLDGAIAAASQKVDCKSGCSYCCHYRVIASAAEILTIAGFIHKLALNEQTQVVKRLRANASATAGLSAQQHESTNVECALLQDNKCLAYDVRPFACRRHHSMNVAACKETFDDPQSPAQNIQSVERLAVAAGVINAHAAGSVRAGLDSNMYELGAALFAAMTDASSGARWKRGKVAFPSVRDRQEVSEAWY